MALDIAIVGGGISGLAACRALAGRHTVELFEAGPTLGGHALTVTADSGRGPIGIDIGFIVYNERRYPHFTRMLADLGVASRETSMSFSVSSRGLEYGSATLGAFFGQRRNLVRPSHYRFIAQILRFLARARRDVSTGVGAKRSLGAYLEYRCVPKDVVERFVIPLASALWSMAPERVAAFPADSFLRFLQQHGMLRPTLPQRWRTIVGGSRRYVDALVARIPATFHAETPVSAIERDDRGVTIHADGRGKRFDRVVIATHADTALELVREPSEHERAILGAIGYSANEAWLHTDESFLPSNPASRASWNYRGEPGRTRVSLTYWMNRLQGIDSPRQFCLTLNPRRPIGNTDVIAKTSFSHPLFDFDAVRAQRRLHELQGCNRTYYCGAYFGYGFHEDGMRSGLEAAARLLADSTNGTSAEVAA